MKVEVDVLGSPSLIVRTVSVDEKQHYTSQNKTQELCESRGGRPGLHIPKSPYGLCGRSATFEQEETVCMIFAFIGQECTYAINRVLFS